jgi:predicted CoA-binding protein
MSNPSDDRLREIYAATATIAVVGASTDPSKPAYRIPAYLQSQGFRILPVNPAGGVLFGEHVYRSLDEIEEQVDVVDVFRPANETADIARQAVGLGAGTLWLQLGIASNEAEEIARSGGLEVVMDLCMGATHQRLGLTRE